MECPKPSVVVSALILLVHAMAAARPGIALKLEPTGTSSHIPPILDCAPAPAGAALFNDDHLSAFRGNVLALLGALPASAAAQAPTAGLVATAQSAGAVGDDRAFARAFCFGPGGDCLECLSAAAQDVADGCHGRRGAVWRAGCFVSYADTNNASTANEEAWRGWFYDDRAGWFYDDDTPTAACMATSTAAECAWCLNASAQVVPALKEGRKLSLLRGDAVVVVGNSCYLRVPLFPATRRWVTYAVFDVVVVVLLIEIGGVLFCLRIARQLNPAARGGGGRFASNGIEVNAVDPTTNYTVLYIQVYPSA